MIWRGLTVNPAQRGVPHTVPAGLAVSLIGFLVLPLIGFLVLQFAMVWGPVITPDSVTYLAAAANLAAGRGISVTAPDGAAVSLTIFAPLYPAVLSLFAFTGIDLVVGMTWLHSLLLPINVVLVGLFLWMDEPRSALVPLIGAYLFLTSEQLLPFHATALSDGLFLTFALASLCLLTSYFYRPRLWPVVAAAIFVGLASLARYQAVALCFGGAAGLWLLSDRRAGERLRLALGFFLLSVLPVSLWFLRNAIAAGNPADKHLLLHPITPGYLVTAAAVFAEIVIPESVLRYIQSNLLAWLNDPGVHQLERSGAVTALILSAGIVSVAVVHAARRWRGPSLVIPSLHLTLGSELLLLFTGSYIALAVGVISFADAGVVLNIRILVLALVCVVVFMARTAPLAFEPRAPGSYGRAVLAALLVYVLVSHPIRSAAWVWSGHTDGLGFNARVWRESAVVAQVMDLPGGVRVYTNGAGQVSYLTGRAAEPFPTKFDSASGVTNPNYSAQFGEMVTQVQQGQAAVAYFEAVRTPSGAEFAQWPTGAELRAAIPQDLMEPEADGWVSVASRLTRAGQ